MPNDQYWAIGSDATQKIQNVPIVCNGTLSIFWINLGDY